MSQHFFYPPTSAEIIGAVTADQGTAGSLANAWPVKITDGTDLVLVNASGELLVAVSALPLPTGGATSAKQDTCNTSLSSIDTKVTGLATEATLSTLNGKVTAVNTGAVVVASSALPSGASTATKQATSDINVTYDYRAMAYVGVTSKVDTITYKTGGSGGTTVATQTFGYDGSDRVTSITTTY